ncbi:hypothetical protein O181_022605 [Austropuccinia psidii MF-1]|uniref:Uncharacterized protein n=1 Tax=Austropuccinia psidii MF-1 TaxID=1389203 RepID=A0A9Q3GY90_9BASI|nr:hypothetical protein [Austropuccinia psidii MF-1]
MPQAMPQTPEKSTEFNEQRPSSPESGSEISDVVSSHELGIEVEIHSQEKNQDSPVLPESQTISRLEKIYKDSRIPDYVRQKISEAMSLLKLDLNHKSITNRKQN